MFKKLTAILLMSIIVLSGTVMSFAEDVKISNLEIATKIISKNATSVEEQLIEDDTSYLNSIGILVENLHDINIYEGSIEYIYIMDNGIESKIDIKSEKDGSKVYSVTENELSDEIIMLNGKVLSMDGTEVDTMAEMIKIYPRSISYETETCPRGVPSEYNDYVRTERKSNIPLEKELMKHTTNGLAIFLSGISGTPFSAAICYYIASQIIVELDGDAMGLSCEAYVYEHEDGPYLGARYERYDTAWYSDTNYNGSSYDVITYKVTEYN